MTSELDNDGNPEGFNEDGVYSKTEFLGILKHVKDQFPNNNDLQNYLESVLPWAESVAPNASITFKMGSDGLLHPIAEYPL